MTEKDNKRGLLAWLNSSKKGQECSDSNRGITCDKDPEQLYSSQVKSERKITKRLFGRLKNSLSAARSSISTSFFSPFGGKRIDDDLFEVLEEQLLTADIGVGTSVKIIRSLTEKASRKDVKDASALYSLLKEEMTNILTGIELPLVINNKKHKPYIVLMVGVNGVGKTATAGKLAKLFQEDGKKVVLAAGDTFRAASVEQLQVWGKRSKVPVIAQHTGADSASVIFDAVKSSKVRGSDIVIADTAGRLQNKSNLMRELEKIIRVMKKIDHTAPHEIMLTLDASTGQNALSQVKHFNAVAPVTGITLTKLDGTAKGGIIFSLADEFRIPIRYVGIGEGINDLYQFKTKLFIDALFNQQ